jgi:hypothetical protein
MARKPPPVHTGTSKAPRSVTTQHLVAQARQVAKAAANVAVALGHQRPSKPGPKLPRRDDRGRFQPRR